MNIKGESAARGELDTIKMGRPKHKWTRRVREAARASKNRCGLKHPKIAALVTLRAVGRRGIGSAALRATGCFTKAYAKRAAKNITGLSRREMNRVECPKIEAQRIENEVHNSPMYQRTRFGSALTPLAKSMAFFLRFGMSAFYQRQTPGDCAV
jgi:hypothetical protein